MMKNLKNEMYKGQKVVFAPTLIKNRPWVEGKWFYKVTGKTYVTKAPTKQQAFSQAKNIINKVLKK